MVRYCPVAVTPQSILKAIELPGLSSGIKTPVVRKLAIESCPAAAPTVGHTLPAVPLVVQGGVPITHARPATAGSVSRALVMSIAAVPVPREAVIV